MRCPSVLALFASFGCSALAPVPRHPWVEDQTLALHEQRLHVEVHEHTVIVDAQLAFRETGEARARTVSFAVAGPRGAARQFTAELTHARGRLALAPVQANASPLPQGRVADAYDIHLPRGPRNFVLHVRYRQDGRDTFRYALLTGAYWSGPIERLNVIVRDPGLRVVEARLEGTPPRSTPRGFEWTLHDIEPRGALELELR